jgi:hypothetical protein
MFPVVVVPVPVCWYVSDGARSADQAFGEYAAQLAKKVSGELELRISSIV